MIVGDIAHIYNRRSERPGWRMTFYSTEPGKATALPTIASAMVAHAILHLTATAASATVAACFVPTCLLAAATRPPIPNICAACAGTVGFQSLSTMTTIYSRDSSVSASAHDGIGRRGYFRARAMMSAGAGPSVGVRGGGADGLGLSEEKLGVTTAGKHDSKVNEDTEGDGV